MHLPRPAGDNVFVYPGRGLGGLLAGVEVGSRGKENDQEEGSKDQSVWRQAAGRDAKNRRPRGGAERGGA